LTKKTKRNIDSSDKKRELREVEEEERKLERKNW
jgi:hypothetical protein